MRTHFLSNPSSRLTFLTAVLGLCFVSLDRAALADDLKPAPSWLKQTLLTDFVSEGAAAGDIDGDGHVDLVSGPYWWRGPEFTERFAYRPVTRFNPSGYSDHFFSFTLDVDGDGDTDVLTIGFPGKEALVYLNPGQGPQSLDWPVVAIADQVSNESPVLMDLVAGGLPELVCSRDSAFGYYQAGEDATKPWTWHVVSEDGVTAKPFGHGMGVGDVDGDGRLDVVGVQDWWQQPVEINGSGEWKKFRWSEQRYGGGGAQILVSDVNRDGVSDIITSFNAHGHGLAWFEGKKTESGDLRFQRHDLIGASSVENPYGVAFSQPHALALADVDRDGFMDLVTGKRWWAHNGHDVGGNQAPVLYWFDIIPSEDRSNVEFVPCLIDDTTGVGTDVLVTDLNGDGNVEVVSANKRGVSIHWHRPSQSERDAGRSARMARWDQGVHDESDFAPTRTAAEAVQAMELPPGFSADVIASEPQMAQPIAMCFDSRGRIWVAEGHTYPIRAPEGEGKDRILILEDRDGDGSFESTTTFAENLNLVSGIEIGFGGVWVGAAPYLMFIADADADDVPDGPPQILLDGWGYQDTHETLNSFRWGPDGWLYGCHGVFTHSKVGKPGTTDAERIPLNAAIWRYHPTRHQFEVFAEGGSNPWGVDFNERGDWFMECCVIPHLFHVIQGARYHRQAGQHFNPYIYEDLPTIADHLHYGDGKFNSMADGGRVDRNLVRKTAATTSMVGGGHAHCGLAIYYGESFPETYRGEIFIHNLHGHRLLRECVEADGSGYVGRHRPDFARMKDHSFVGVTVMVGPDGSLFISDWHDPQTCHHRDPNIWDRTNGRIYRLRYGDVQTTNVAVPRLGDAELVAALASPNGWLNRAAAHELHQRAASGTLDRAAIAPQLVSLTSNDQDEAVRVRAVWSRHVCGLLSETELLQLMNDPSETIRGWAIQFACEPAQALSPEMLNQLTELAQRESSLWTRRYLASALQRIPLDQRWQLAEAFVKRTDDVVDKNIPLLAWYAIEPLAAADPARAIGIVNASPHASLKDKVQRRTASTESGRAAIVAMLQEVNDVGQWNQRTGLLLGALPAIGRLPAPTSWNDVRKQGMKLASQSDAAASKQLAESLMKLGARFGDDDAVAHYRQIAVDSSESVELRRQALVTLMASKAKGLGETAAKVLGERALQEIAMQAIVESADATVADQVISKLNELPVKLQADAINFLATRVATASQLIERIGQEKLDRSIVPVAILRQLKSLGDEKLNASIQEIWGNVGSTPANLDQQMARWRKVLSPNRLADADVNHGRHVFNQVCGNCHRLFGEGQTIGPDLTGSNRASVDYLLENVLAPNALIGNAYQMHAILMQDGRLITGLIRSETEEAITLVMTAGTEVTIDPDEIDERKLSDQSMMPMELFDKMAHADVIDLVAYLRTPKQVDARTKRAQRTVLRVEGESLLENPRVTAGTVIAQPMKGFGGDWSGDSQLWWTGAKPGEKLTLIVPAPMSGQGQVRIRLTTAPDYGQVRITIDGQSRDADLYHDSVSIYGNPLVWDDVSVKEGEPIPVVIEITGHHSKAVPRFMVGVDCIEFRR